MNFKLSTSGQYFYSTGLLMKIYVCNQNISSQKLFCRKKIQFGQRNSCWLIKFLLEHLAVRHTSTVKLLYRDNHIVFQLLVL